MTEVGHILKETLGIRSVVAIGGYSFLTGTASPNSGVLFAVLEPWSDRDTPELQARASCSACAGG